MIDIDSCQSIVLISYTSSCENVCENGNVISLDIQVQVQVSVH